MSLTKVKDAVGQFEEKKKRLLTFMSDHENEMEEFFVLVGEYNQYLSEAKDLLRGASEAGAIRVGPLSRSAKPKYIRYDPQKVPVDILTIPGVVKDLDYKKIDALVSVGAVNEEDIAPAKNIVYGSARISGPKEIILKL